MVPFKLFEPQDGAEPEAQGSRPDPHIRPF